ncbi:MAG: RluA family pseudouridine synthase [Lentisphaerota bacterium]
MPILDFLAGKTKLSRKKAKALLDLRVVFVNNKRIWMARHPLSVGDRVEIHTETAPVGKPKIKTLHEDADYLIIDKPPGWLSNGPDSLEDFLRAAIPNASLQAVHRLDRDTTGCLLFAKSQEAFERMVLLFKSRAITKLYQTIVHGRVSGSTDEVSLPIDGEPAVTKLQILDSNVHATHLKLLIETGRTHQVRRHMQSIHHPVIGDKSYFTTAQDSAPLREVSRQMLHAVRLAFKHPVSGEVVRVTAPLPADFKACLRALKLT